MYTSAPQRVAISPFSPYELQPNAPTTTQANVDPVVRVTAVRVTAVRGVMLVFFVWG